MEWNWDKLSKTLSRAGQGVSEKVKGTAEIVQTRQKKASAENELDALFVEIGRAFYETHPAEISEEMAVLFAQVEEVTDRIAAAQEDLNRLRGTKLCPECGAEIAPDALFCSKCGAAAPIPEEPAEETETVVVEEESVEVDGGDDFAQKAAELTGQAEEAVEEAVCAVEEGLDAAAEKAEEAVCAAEESAEAAAGKAEEVAGQTEEAAEQVNDAAEAAKEKAQKTVDQVAEAAEKAVDVAQDLAKEAWVKAGKFASDLKDRLKSGE